MGSVMVFVHVKKKHEYYNAAATATRFPGPPPDRKNHRGGLVTIKQSSRAKLRKKKNDKTSRVIL